MVIDKHISKYSIFSGASIAEALKKINENKLGFVFGVNQQGKLVGMFTDGDFRRWLLEQKTVDVSQSIDDVLNTQCRYHRITDDIQRIEESFSERIKMIPLVDAQHHLVAVATKQRPDITIGDVSIHDSSPTFVIAEIGNNHNGDVALAKRLVDEAKRAGADCAKFQMRQMTALHKNSGDASDMASDLGDQYVLDLLSKFQLTNEQLFEIFDYCKEVGILPLCTPFDAESVSILESYGMPAYKIGSPDFSNHDLIAIVVDTGKPLIISSGMSTEQEIANTVRLLQSKGANYVLLHCNSAYPPAYKDIHLQYLTRLEEMSGTFVGYSGHERDIFVPVGAVARGAKVVEKHFTLDRSMEGNDHRISLLPDEFARMVEGIRQVEKAVGTRHARTVTQGEKLNREVLGKSLMVARNMNIGEVFREEDLDIKSPGQGLPPYRKHELIGKPAIRSLKKGDVLFYSDIYNNGDAWRTYSFERPFGLPVRFHDVYELTEKTNLDFVEFHLSYKDLEVDIADVFSEPLACGLVVHSPELFAGDHIMDLCSEDEAYRARSIEELQRVIDMTRALKKYFPNTSEPGIIVNVGGALFARYRTKEERVACYDRLHQSISKVDSTGVQLWPQTMPPLPWHFGGQRFQSILVEAEEIVAFCKKSGLRVCFDVSHSKLACAQLKQSFSEFVEAVGPYTAHLHLVDARGTDGEGLQIEEGDIDFKKLAQQLTRLAPDASFIPEIWQGHKNDGEGFRIALERLEKYF